MGEFKAGLGEEKTKLNEMQRKAKEHEDHRKKIKAKYESKMKKEKVQKDEVKKAKEKKGKAAIKAFEDSKKATAAKAKAKVEARKMKRMAEKTAREAKIAAQTLREELGKQKKWKITLQERRKQEKDDREKEMKTVPHKILKAEAKKYRKITAAALKAMNKDKKAYACSYGRWNAQEKKVKGLTAKERMLKGEKKSLFKALANAVRSEYRTGKKLKRRRKQMDAEDKITMKKETDLGVMVKKEIGDKALKKEAAKK